jgi:hypothetical protein
MAAFAMLCGRCSIVGDGSISSASQQPARLQQLGDIGDVSDSFSIGGKRLRVAFDNMRLVPAVQPSAKRG